MLPNQSMRIQNPSPMDIQLRRDQVLGDSERNMRSSFKNAKRASSRLSEQQNLLNQQNFQTSGSNESRTNSPSRMGGMKKMSTGLGGETDSLGMSASKRMQSQRQGGSNPLNDADTSSQATFNQQQQQYQQAPELQKNFKQRRLRHYFRQLNDVKEQIDTAFQKMEDENTIKEYNEKAQDADLKRAITENRSHFRFQKKANKLDITSNFYNDLDEVLESQMESSFKSSQIDEVSKDNTEPSLSLDSEPSKNQGISPMSQRGLSLNDVLPSVFMWAQSFLCKECVDKFEANMKKQIGENKMEKSNELEVPSTKTAKGPRDHNKLTAKQMMLEKFHKKLGNHLKEERGKFRVPIEYQQKFMANLSQDSEEGGSAEKETSQEEAPSEEESESGELNNSGSVMRGGKAKKGGKDKTQLQNEIRISYLESALTRLQILHTKEIKQSQIRMEDRMRNYARKCLYKVRDDLKDEFHFLFSQLDQMKSRENQLESENDMMTKRYIAMTMEINELKSWATWDEVAHDDFTKKLKKAGLAAIDIENVAQEFDVLRATYQGKQYYDGLIRMTDIERDALDFAKPFGLFNGYIRVGISERINLLERETVKIYQKKLNETAGYLEEVQMSMKNDQNITQIMEKDKIRLENFVKDLTHDFRTLKKRFKKEREEKDDFIRSLINKFETRLYNIHNNKEGLQDMFLKELLIKDKIIHRVKGIKEKYQRMAKELNMKLQIPRHHLDFLKSKGTLDHFVQAKLTGDDVTAKWILLKSGKQEISQIEQKNEIERQQKELIAKKHHKLKIYGLLDRVTKSEENDPEMDDWSSLGPFSAKRSAKSPRDMTGSLMSGEDPDDRGFFDLNFHDILQDNEPKTMGSSLADIKQKIFNKFHKGGKRNIRIPQTGALNTVNPDQLLSDTQIKVLTHSKLTEGGTKDVSLGDTTSRRKEEEGLSPSPRGGLGDDESLDSFQKQKVKELRLGGFKDSLLRKSQDTELRLENYYKSSFDFRKDDPLDQQQMDKMDLMGKDKPRVFASPDSQILNIYSRQASDNTTLRQFDKRFDEQEFEQIAKKTSIHISKTMAARESQDRFSHSSDGSPHTINQKKLGSPPLQTTHTIQSMEKVKQGLREMSEIGKTFQNQKLQDMVEGGRRKRDARSGLVIAHPVKVTNFDSQVLDSASQSYIHERTEDAKVFQKLQKLKEHQQRKIAQQPEADPTSPSDQNTATYGYTKFKNTQQQEKKRHQPRDFKKALSRKPLHEKISKGGAHLKLLATERSHKSNQIIRTLKNLESKFSSIDKASVETSLKMESREQVQKGERLIIGEEHTMQSNSESDNEMKPRNLNEILLKDQKQAPAGKKCVRVNFKKDIDLLDSSRKKKRVPLKDKMSDSSSVRESSREQLNDDLHDLSPVGIPEKRPQVLSQTSTNGKFPNLISTKEYLEQNGNQEFPYPQTKPSSQGNSRKRPTRKKQNDIRTLFRSKKDDEEDKGSQTTLKTGSQPTNIAGSKTTFKQGELSNDPSMQESIKPIMHPIKLQAIVSTGQSDGITPQMKVTTVPSALQSGYSSKHDLSKYPSRRVSFSKTGGFSQQKLGAQTTRDPMAAKKLSKATSPHVASASFDNSDVPPSTLHRYQGGSQQGENLMKYTMQQPSILRPQGFFSKRSTRMSRDSTRGKFFSPRNQTFNFKSGLKSERQLRHTSDQATAMNTMSNQELAIRGFVTSREAGGGLSNLTLRGGTAALLGTQMHSHDSSDAKIKMQTTNAFPVKQLPKTSYQRSRPKIVQRPAAPVKGKAIFSHKQLLELQKAAEEKKHQQIRNSRIEVDIMSSSRAQDRKLKYFSSHSSRDNSIYRDKKDDPQLQADMYFGNTDLDEGEFNKTHHPNLGGSRKKKGRKQVSIDPVSGMNQEFTQTLKQQKKESSLVAQKNFEAFRLIGIHNNYDKPTASQKKIQIEIQNEEDLLDYEEISLDKLERTHRNLMSNNGHFKISEEDIAYLPSQPSVGDNTVRNDPSHPTETHTHRSEEKRLDTRATGKKSSVDNRMMIDKYEKIFVKQEKSGRGQQQSGSKRKSQTKQPILYI